MSVIVRLCEQPCPIHDWIVCCEEVGHDPPHRTVLVGSKAGQAARDRILIEWRLARDEDHDNGVPKMTPTKPRTDVKGTR